jgi:hypothetical protein
LSALTIEQLLLTAGEELGLGFIAWLGFCKIVPSFRKMADERTHYDRWFTTTTNPLVWLFHAERLGLIYGRPAGRKVNLVKDKPTYLKTSIAWTGSQWFILLMCELLPTFILLTSVGWKLPFQNHLYYNLIFATANGAPNGAHITSYLAVMVITLFVSIKTRDVFLGVLSGALLVGVHEGFWILFYYAGYWQFVTLSMWTNILKDWPIFSGMIVLFVFAFTQYSSNRWKLSQFKIPILLYIGYLALWFVIPHLVFHYSNWLPIRTANLPDSAITVTQYNETPWFYNPYVSLIEIFSWLMLASGLLIVFATSGIRYKIQNSEKVNIPRANE